MNNSKIIEGYTFKNNGEEWVAAEVTDCNAKCVTKEDYESGKYKKLIQNKQYDEQCLRRLEAGICASWYGGHISHQPHEIIAENGTRFPFEPQIAPNGINTDFAYPTATMMLPSGNWVNITRYHEGDEWQFDVYNCFSGDLIASIKNVDIKVCINKMIKSEAINIAA